MSNTYTGNVIKVDTSAAFAHATRIDSIKYIGATSASAVITGNGASTGGNLWEQGGSATVMDADVNIRDNQGVYVTVTNGAVVYLYLAYR